MSSVGSRILAGAGANGFAQIASVVIQVFSVPLFLRNWSPSTYGDWLILAAIPAYLSFADVGLVNSFGNALSRAVAIGDPRTNRIFQSAVSLIAAILLTALICIGVVVSCIPLGSGKTFQDARGPLMMLLAGAVIAQFGGVAEAVFKSTHRYPLGTLLATGVRLGEWAGAMTALMLDGSFLGVAAGGLTMRLIGTILLCIAAKPAEHGMRWGVRQIGSDEIRSLFRPAFSFIMIPLSGALVFQGMTILVGVALGPVAVATFNIYRTISRLAVQITAVISHSAWPELTRLHANQAGGLMLHIYRRCLTLTNWFSLITVTGLFFATPLVLKTWTTGKIPYNFGLSGAMLGYALLGSFNHVPRILLLATEKHARLALVTFTGAVLLVGYAALAGALVGTFGIALGMVAYEGVLLIATLHIIRDRFFMNNGAIGCA